MQKTTANKPSSSPANKLLLQPMISDIVAANFSIAPDVLAEHVPPGLELDDYNGETYISLIAQTVSKAGPFGMFGKFNQLSLRFYVRRKSTGISRKGTCSLKSYVSNGTGAFLLGSKFIEEFKKLKIKNSNSGFNGNGIPNADYSWQVEENQNRLRVKARSPIKNDGPNTKVGFILSHTNHYEGNRGKTLEYRIDRPNWTAWDAAKASFTCDVKRLFGLDFVKPLAKRPASVFVTAGSVVSIYRPVGIN
ncbi:MAG: DUF2071 domain-containing protein [Planctomycetota bacterium]